MAEFHNDYYLVTGVNQQGKRASFRFDRKDFADSTNAWMNAHDAFYLLQFGSLWSVSMKNGLPQKKLLKQRRLGGIQSTKSGY
jgi:hypothetical protein